MTRLGGMYALVEHLARRLDKHIESENVMENNDK